MRGWLTGGVLVLLGVLVVALLMTFRVDVEAAARSGPRWRRRLVGAGLAVLTTLGILSTTGATRAMGVSITCYVMDIEPNPLPPTAAQLAERLRELELMIGSNRLDLSVTTKLLDTIEAEVKALSNENRVIWLVEPDPAKNMELAGKVMTEVSRVRAMLAAASQPANAALQQITDQDLAASPEWKKITATWTEAGEIAAGKKGPYPFDEKGKKRLLDALNGISADIEKLHGSELLSDAEAGLLTRELATLRDAVERKRPKELEAATCYKPMALPAPAQASIKRLTERLPLLEGMAASDRLHSSVATKVLDTIEADAKVLADKKQTEALSETDRLKATELSVKATAQVERIRARLAAAQGGDSLEDNPNWKTILNAWTTAGALADQGSTTAQRRDADKLLDQARLKAKELAAAGLLARAEADLLCADADRLHERIYATMPTDSKVTCYDMACVPAAKESLERLNKRLPLLKQLAADGKLHPAAVRKVLPVIEADLKTLSDTKETGKLGSTDQTQAKKTSDEVKMTLVGIKKALGDGQ